MSKIQERGPRGRFVPGQSGNPGGRPRTSKSVDGAILKAMNEKIIVNENGKRRKISKAEATAKQFANKGASGDIRAGKIALDMTAKAEDAQRAARTSEPGITLGDQEIINEFLGQFRARIISGEDQ
tara:strand:+ start:2656 stop:3033 length:378 start_codon:yes stop_codon:yes gene_type:complete